MIPRGPPRHVVEAEGLSPPWEVVYAREPVGAETREDRRAAALIAEVLTSRTTPASLRASATAAIRSPLHAHGGIRVATCILCVLICTGRSAA